MKGRSRRFLVTIVVLAVVCAIVYRSRGILRLGDFSGTRLLQVMAGTRISLLVAAVALSYVGYLVRALRWQRFCRLLGPTRLMNVFNAILMGFSAMFALGRAGEPIPPLLQARKNNLPVSNMFGLYVIERLFDLAGIAMLAAFGLMYFPAALAAGADGQAWQTKIRATGGVLLLGFAFVVGLVVYFRLHGAGVLSRYLVAWHGGAAGGGVLRRNLRVSAKGCRRFGRSRICWRRCFTRACTGLFSRWSTCWSFELLAAAGRDRFHGIHADSGVHDARIGAAIAGSRRWRATGHLRDPDANVRNTAGAGGGDRDYPLADHVLCSLH